MAQRRPRRRQPCGPLFSDAHVNRVPAAPVACLELESANRKHASLPRGAPGSLQLWRRASRHPKAATPSAKRSLRRAPLQPCGGGAPPPAHALVGGDAILHGGAGLLDRPGLRVRAVELLQHCAKRRRVPVHRCTAMAARRSALIYVCSMRLSKSAPAAAVGAAARVSNQIKRVHEYLRCSLQSMLLFCSHPPV